MEVKAFTKPNPKYKILNLPEEDCFRFDKKLGIFAVADGITRDPEGIIEIPGLLEVSEIESVIENYPRPSPAGIAAGVFCDCFLDFLKKEKNIKKGFKFCNKEIKKLNDENNPHPDYLVNDFWACVGAGGFVFDGKLYWGFVGDCGVAVFDKKGKLKFKTKDEVVSKKRGKEIENKYNTEFKFAKGRKITRSLYRNNPANPLAYGALTGEKNAEGYFKFGCLDLVEGDFVVFYSDGFVSLLFSKDFNIAREFENLEDYFEEGSWGIDGGEGTLICAKI